MGRPKRRGATSESGGRIIRAQSEGERGVQRRITALALEESSGGEGESRGIVRRITVVPELEIRERPPVKSVPVLPVQRRRTLEVQREVRIGDVLIVDSHEKLMYYSPEIDKGEYYDQPTGDLLQVQYHVFDSRSHVGDVLMVIDEVIEQDKDWWVCLFEGRQVYCDKTEVATYCSVRRS